MIFALNYQPLVAVLGPEAHNAFASCRTKRIEAALNHRNRLIGATQEKQAEDGCAFRKIHTGKDTFPGLGVTTLACGNASHLGMFSLRQTTTSCLFCSSQNFRTTPILNRSSLCYEVVTLSQMQRRQIMAEANDNDFYDKVFPVPDRVREKSYIKSRAEYDKLYKESIKTRMLFGQKWPKKD